MLEPPQPPPPLLVELAILLPDELGGMWLTDVLMRTVPRVGERVAHGPAIFVVTDVIHYALSENERRAARLQVADEEPSINGPRHQYPWWMPRYGWRRLMEGQDAWEPTD